MPRPLAPVTIRTALLVGFGLTLGLWLFTGYHVTRRITDEQQVAAATNARYIQAQDLLASVRAQVLLASVVVGDALLDADPRAPSNPHDVMRTFHAIDALLDQYVPVFDAALERGRVARLRHEVDDFRMASDAVLASDDARSRFQAPILLRRLIPKREAAIRTSEELQALNRAASVDGQRALVQRQVDLQRQVWGIFGVAVFISLLIAWFASRHVTRLERRLTEQRAREARVSADLQRLSARLVRVQEEEHRRIARELHDEVGQALSAVKVELSVAERRLERLHGEQGLLADAQSSAESALRSVRDLTHLLHPPALEDLGLVAALESFVREFRARHGVAMTFVADALEERQHPEIERAVYRIVQEALTNIARHASARAGQVALRRERQLLRVTIEDDGVGFDDADVERPGGRRGLGLLGMRERVSQLHGRIEIHSAPDKGTRIDVELPSVDRPVPFEEVPDPRVMAALAMSYPEVDRE